MQWERESGNMSRIFDALQRSGTEQSGIEYPDLVSVVTEVFEAPKEQRPFDRTAVGQAVAVEPAAVEPFVVEPVLVRVPAPAPVTTQPVMAQPISAQQVTALPSAATSTSFQTTTTDPFTKEVTGDG